MKNDVYPSLAEARRYERNYRSVPISRTILSDSRTPVEVLRALKAVSRHCFILESLEDAARWGRYTFLGYDPKLEFTCLDGTVRIRSGTAVTIPNADPAGYIRQILAENKSPRLPGLPPFTGGLMGYFAYDSIKYAEPTLDLEAADEERFNDIDLMLFDKIIAFDNFRQTITMIVNIRTDELEENYRAACMELDGMESLIRRGTPAVNPPLRLKGDFAPLFDRERYCAMVEKTKNYIFEGDIFQAVISNRLTAEAEGSLLDTYRLLGEEYSAEREYMLAEQTYGVGIDLFEKEHESSGFEPTEDIGKLYADMGDIDYFISGKMDVALGSYIKSVESKNDTPSVRYRIGFIQYTKKNFAEALGSFIKSHEGAPDDTHVLLALANTHSLRDDNLAAQAYYTELLDILDNQRRLYGVMLPQVRADQGDLVDTYMKASNNLGVTLSRLANQTGNSKLNAESIVRLQDSLRAYDALTRNQETMVRLEGSNLAAQNIKYITEPISEFDPGIYTQIPRIINDEEGLE